MGEGQYHQRTSIIFRPGISDDEVEALMEPTPFARGSSREVYRVKENADCVVKKAISARPTSNMIEWFVWLGSADHPPLANVLGRCFALSESGRYLVMERLDDIDKGDYSVIPDVPLWLNDLKPDAFGKRHGTIKVRDYGVLKYDKLLKRKLGRPPAFAMNARTALFLDNLGGAKK